MGSHFTSDLTWRWRRWLGAGWAAAAPLSMAGTALTAQPSLAPGQLVQLLGPAGAGKTTLALQLAHACLAGGAAVAWLDGDGTLEPSRLAALGAPAYFGVPSSQAQAWSFCCGLLRPGLGLLVLDAAHTWWPGRPVAAAAGPSGAALWRAARAAGAIVLVCEICRRRPAAAAGLTAGYAGTRLWLSGAAAVEICRWGAAVRSLPATLA